MLWSVGAAGSIHGRTLGREVWDWLPYWSLGFDLSSVGLFVEEIFKRNFGWWRGSVIPRRNVLMILESQGVLCKIGS